MHLGGLNENQQSDARTIYQEVMAASPHWKRHDSKVFFTGSDPMNFSFERADEVPTFVKRLQAKAITFGDGAQQEWTEGIPALVSLAIQESVKNLADRQKTK